MKEITLSTGAKVEIIEKVTWGQQEAIRSTLLGGMNMGMGKGDSKEAEVKFNATVLSEARYKALEVCVTKITEVDGSEHKFTREWMNELSLEDGDAVFNAVDAVTNPEKK